MLDAQGSWILTDSEKSGLGGFVPIIFSQTLGLANECPGKCLGDCMSPPPAQGVQLTRNCRGLEGGAGPHHMEVVLSLIPKPSGAHPTFLAPARSPNNTRSAQSPGCTPLPGLPRQGTHVDLAGITASASGQAWHGCMAQPKPQDCTPLDRQSCQGLP